MSSGTNGKGSARRRAQISEAQLAANWDAIFGKRPAQPVSSGTSLPGRVLIADGDGVDWEIPDIRAILGEEKWREAKEQRIL